MLDEVYDELIQEFYGIDALTRKVDNVAICRSGRISHWTEKKGYEIHLMTGKNTRNEVAKIFGLIALVEVHPRTPNDKRLQILLDLQAKSLKVLDATAADLTPESGTTRTLISP